MQPWIIAVICIAVVACVIAALFALAAACHKIAFGKRADKNPLLKYFTAEDFSLTAKEVSIPAGKNLLKGYIYGGASVNGKLVIFVHGMGPGHIAYTTEIAYFCKQGYKVLAVDSTGCNFSEGKNIRGMYEGVKTAVAAIDFAKSHAELKNMPVCLVGHSWGGYSALCASAERKVNAVVALSAPVSPVKTLYCGAAPVISKPLAAMLTPFWRIINLFIFGKKGNLSAVKAAKKSRTPTLIIHGDKDNVVGMGNAAYYKKHEDNVTLYLAKGKAHNPYNTAEAEAKLAELLSNLSKAGKMTKEERAYFSAFDYKAATEEDAEVMRVMSDFLEKNT